MPHPDSMGRVAQKLAELLKAEGFDVTLFMPATGHWRSSPYADVVRWEAHAWTPNWKGVAQLSSWDTMTDCVRYGITLEPERTGPNYRSGGHQTVPGHWEVWAKSPKSKETNK